VIRNSLLNTDASSDHHANANNANNANNDNTNSTTNTNNNNNNNNNTNQSSSHIFSPNFEDGSRMGNLNGNGTGTGTSLDVSNPMNFSNFSSRLSFGSNANDSISANVNGNVNVNTNISVNTNVNVNANGVNGNVNVNGNAGRKKSMRSSRVRNSRGSASYTISSGAGHAVNSSGYGNGNDDGGHDVDVNVKEKKDANSKDRVKYNDQHDDEDEDQDQYQDQYQQNENSNFNSNDPNQKLRNMIHNLLHAHHNNTTPSPASAVFYASILYTKTTSLQDAYLFATALWANDEKRRAGFILEKAGLLSFESVVASQRNVHGHGHGPSYGGGSSSSGRQDSVWGEGITSEKEYMRLVLEAMLLASSGFGSFGEWDEVTAILEDATKYPFELTLEEIRESKFLEKDYQRRQSGGVGVGQEDANANANATHGSTLELDDGEYKLEQEVEIGLRRLAHFLLDTLQECDIHPVARLCLMRGKACDEASNPSRAAAFLKLSLEIDVKCIEAWSYLCQRRLMTSQEEIQLVIGLRLDDVGSGMEWLKDIFYARLAIAGDADGDADTGNVNAAANAAGISVDHNNLLPSIASPIASASISTPMNILAQQATPQMSMDASSIQFQRTPSTPFNFNTVTGAGTGAGLNASQNKTPGGNSNSNHVKKQVETSFQNLHFKHHLSQSPEVLALAANRAYNAYNLSLALHYCQVLYEMDPLSVHAAGIQIATLTALGHKRPLFRLAHALVDADSKSPTAWYAVGCYYYACGRYDLAQQHYWRATRLGPRNANCWVAFGCAFAACDENDQANACFRTAQRLNSGSHYPMLYMGMEHLRTNNIPLAGHFLKSSRSMEKNDPLCCNELGVWAYRSREWKDGIRWFILALRLYVESVVSEKSALSWNEEDSKQDVSSKVNRPRFEFGQRQGRDTVASFSDNDCIEFCQDAFWEPTIFNLGQCYRKARRFEEAGLCFQKCLALCPEKAMSFSALGFTRHLAGDIDGAIASYHQALSRKPDDPFASEMLNRAMRESLDMGSMIIPVEGDVSLSMHDMGIGTSRSRSNLEDSPFSLGDSDVSMSC
jgi:anaphase-promoting complex subunit 6